MREHCMGGRQREDRTSCSCSSPIHTAFPITTPEPLVLVSPPRCLTANRTQQGVLLSWLPPANHSFPIDRYIMEFRVGERWETLDDAIPGTDGDFFAKDLSQVRVARLHLSCVQLGRGWPRSSIL